MNQSLVDVLLSCGVSFATGVPDSSLSEFCEQIANCPKMTHVTAANEGSALALAAGHSLASGCRAVVYMQNSGLPNAINPYLSVSHPKAYSIASVLLIGWRGEPGVSDEPQHHATGEATRELLRVLDIPYFHLNNFNDSMLFELQTWLRLHSDVTTAVLVSNSPAKRQKFEHNTAQERELKREAVLSSILKKINPADKLFAGIGHVGRELLAIRGPQSLDNFKNDFLCVGGMGHASQIALGYALSSPNDRVWCLDGDGAFIMHMGACTWLTRRPVNNFIHVLLDNGVHASVGGQPISGENIDFGAIAVSIGYKKVHKVETPQELDYAISAAIRDIGPTMIWCRIDKSTPISLPRPVYDLHQLKETFSACNK